MPLVMLYGQPFTGKQRVTDELVALCQNNNVQCREISPRLLGIKDIELIQRQTELNKLIYQETQKYVS